jgi:CRP/FNR family cyclic AMP-dependent transcriptional regulator
MSEVGSFLSGLGEAEQAALAQRWRVSRYERGEMILAHDEQSCDVFLVLDGHARVTVFSEAGKAVAYREIGPGGIFGELAAIDGKPRSASVVALDSVRAASLSATAFREVVNSQPELAWALLMHLALQVRRMTDRIYEFSTLVVRKRLVRELLRMAHAVADEAGSAIITPAPTHFDLAARISTHREAVSREMSSLARQKLVVRKGRSLLVLDVKLLEELAEAEA